MAQASYEKDKDEINFNLGREDFIHQLVDCPNFKYNYNKMWIRQIILEWANDASICELFQEGSGSDILPMWMYYVICKLRVSKTEECSTFCKLLQTDIKHFYDFYAVEQWQCLKKENVDKIIQDKVDEFLVEDDSVGEISQDIDEISYENNTNDAYQIFNNQFNVLINLIEKTLGTNFKFNLFLLAFEAESEQKSQIIQTKYHLEFSKKYLLQKESEIGTVAKVASQHMLENTSFCVSDMSSEEEDFGKNTPASSFIMPSSAA